MKMLLIMLFLITVPSKQQRNNDLFGKWKIIKVKSNSKIITPTMDFILTISEDSFTFNRDVNHCSAKPIITKTSIEFDRELCSRACCDGRNDPIGEMSLYRGHYVVTKNSLIIQNEKVKTYLERIETNR